MKILLAGGSGLIGNALRTHFTNKGYEVRILSRSKKKKADYFYWDPEHKKIDLDAFKDVSIIINLAGATISKGRWTNSQKQLLKSSRTESTSFLLDQAKNHCPELKTYIGSSAVGIYEDGRDQILNESAPIGTDFLSDLASEWENAHKKADQIQGVRTCILRIGIVLSKLGGAYPVFKKNMILGISPNFGSKLYYPLIHIKDVVKAFDWILTMKMPKEYTI